MATETQMQLLDQLAKNQQRQLFENQSSVPMLIRRAKPRQIGQRVVTLQEAIRSGADRVLYMYDVMHTEGGRSRLQRDLFGYWKANLHKWLRPQDGYDFDHAEAAEIQQLLRELDAADDSLNVYPLFNTCRIHAEMDASN